MAEESLSSWSKQHTSLFIDLLEQYPCLWKVKTKEYKNRDLRNVAINNICIEMSSKINCIVTHDIIVRKIHTLRTQFRREVKAAAVASRRAGATPAEAYTYTHGHIYDPAYTPRLWCFDELSFLDDSDAQAAYTWDDLEPYSQDTAADTPGGEDNGAQSDAGEGDAESRGGRVGAETAGDTLLSAACAAAPAIVAPEDAAKNLRFIREIEQYPCLYNFSLPEYTKRQTTTSAWQSVAEVMQDTVHNCKEKWRNLRTVFVRKMKASPAEASSGKKTPSKPYYLTEAMQFLLPYVRGHQTITRTPTHTKKYTDPDTDEDGLGEVKKERIDVGYGDGDGGSRKLFLLSLLDDVHAMSDAQMRKFRKLVLDAIDVVLEEMPNGGSPGHT
ncbi:hypothetical protein GWK47_022617 [Chionoecetes opilio]|uniref:MADF domain-containing protein n=1 Tax=Chionoecetes opilio TaxID=41210 RepID=A0A8J4XMW9_CHIOP|nr:hypothetical protein GWK47_022617 [Chionoecetes opilio]